jgi:hypothetical protein
MLTPALGQTTAQSTAQASQDNQPSGLSEAQHMVRARASLTHALDSNSIHSGDQFRATLSDNVHLNSGVVLRKGDALVGTVADDDMNTTGKSHLAVRFTQAVLKNGQTIPVKATIVALYVPDDLAENSFGGNDQIPNSWNDGTLRVDQVGVVKGVDLHSQISSQNSGVFVSQKNNVKLPAGSELALAIAANSSGSTNPTNSGS